MNRINKIAVIMATVLTVAFTACTKPDETVSVRDIYYTVSDNGGISSIMSGGTTAHLTTERQWDELLDSFCDYAADGELVTFCSYRQSVKAQKDTPTSITTSSREELKKWMKEMERSGRTVNVTYNDNTGVWSGTAYANLGGNTASTAEELTYTGILTAAPMPALEQSSPDGSVLALQTTDNNTLIIAMHGMMLLIEDSNALSVFRDIDISFKGCVYQHYDRDGQIFSVLELLENQDNVLFL